MKRLNISIIALAAVLPLPFSAHAEDVIELGEIVITQTASTEAVELGRTGATVNVVTDKDLKRTGDQSIATLLARLPGVSIARQGGLGTSTALRIRGLSGPYIGVRIDGIDVADPSGTQCLYDFGATTSGGVSRIEVLRGSQSALFGSEAVGGVVDVTTFRATAEGTEAQVSLESGSNATYAGTVSVGMKSERAELSFSASRTLTDGISASSTGVEKDGFRATTLSFFGQYALTDAVTVGLNGFARNSFTEFDSPPADGNETEEGKLRGLRAFVTADAGVVAHELSFAHTDTERFYPLGFTKLFIGDRDQLAYKGKWDASDKLSVNFGLDHTSETFKADAVTGSSRTSSVYAEALYAVNDTLDLSLALRYDDHNSFGRHLSGRAAMAWRPAQDWVIRAVAGTGFRAPSLYELYGPYGNTALNPEESKSFELGAEYLTANGGSLGVTLFNTDIDNKIQWAGGAYNQVPGTTKTRGVEITGRTEIVEGWALFGNYTYTDAKDVTGAGVETPTLRVPRHDLVLGVEGQITDRLSGTLTVQHVTDVWDINAWPLASSKMADYTVANLAVSYDINDTASAYLRIENLFDETYETVRGYGQPGRSVYVGLQAKF